MPLHSLKVGSYGTHNALGLAKFKRARFLLASTSEVYGDPEQHPQPETYWGNVNPVGPRGVYDEAKRYAEALTMAYHGQQGVDTAIVRIFNTYGPRMRPNDGRAVSNFVRQALAEEPLTVFGDGSQTRSFCYVDDLIRGIVLLAEVTLQPVRRHGVDAAVLFADIMSPVLGMGVDVQLVEGVGPVVEHAVDSAKEVERLRVASPEEWAVPILEAVRLVRGELEP